MTSDAPPPAPSRSPAVTGRGHRGLWAAIGLGLALTGCGGPAPPPEPSGPSAFPPCWDAAGRLTADVDNDGHLDRVTGTRGIGAELGVSFGGESGFAEPRTPPDLVGSPPEEEGEEVKAAVADFDGDGWLDLAIAAATLTGGDDVVPPRVAELRLGPFSERGTGQRTVGLDLQSTVGLRVVDFDEDAHPDLASYYYDGDGVYEMLGMLGGAEDGLGGRVDHEIDIGDPYDDVPDKKGPSEHLPPAALDRFHPTCDA
ncbi:VCBS repeat-containing protein [Nocardiopsis dassonvillei]|uniref:FG-GAP repeat domain-containing protein n=1 Tax=Nocardiopsis dassonvillei TaxID=2014 RepID=UPI0020A4B82E|nr:VCBS repeat-containing protein [Nocardiopsis dassonvillei]MCP3013104.1 VCBS repeat-containing protein [Nocardiopsis dassonvillei]